MNWLSELIQSTHVELPLKMQAYGPFHILFVVVSLYIIVTVCYFARKSSDKAFRIVMLSVGGALLLSEIYKQLYYLYAAGGAGYDWYIFPFQLCSVPMYLAIVVGCMKKNAVRDAICEYLACIGFLGGIMAYAEPSGILNGHYFSLAHSCIWHALLIFIALYILVTGNAAHRLRDYWKALVVFAGVVVTATTLNLIFCKKPGFNMCYISPFDTTPLAVFDSFDKLFMELMGQYPGRIVSICIYLFAVSLGGFAIYSASFGIIKLVNKIKKKKIAK